MDLERGTASQSDNQDDTEEVGNAQQPLGKKDSERRVSGSGGE